MILKKLRFDFLNKLRDGNWHEVENIFKEIFIVNPLMKQGFIQQRIVGGTGAHWAEYQITQLGRTFIKINTPK